MDALDWDQGSITPDSKPPLTKRFSKVGAAVGISLGTALSVGNALSLGAALALGITLALGMALALGAADGAFGDLADFVNALALLGDFVMLGAFDTLGDLVIFSRSLRRGSSMIKAFWLSAETDAIHEDTTPRKARRLLW